jgi:hypothetical protein
MKREGKRMQILFWIIFSTLLITTTGCNPPKIRPQERCFNQYNFNFASKAEIEEFFITIDQYQYDEEKQKVFLKDVLAKFGKARCNMYDLNNIKPVDPKAGYDKPLLYNDLIGGFSAESWAKEITPWGKESKQFYKDTCRRRRR